MDADRTMNDFRLLVVEDEADQRTLLAGLLSAEGYSVACAASPTR